MDLTALIKKYSTAGPRYTSYPTAPQFNEAVGAETYRERLSSPFLGDDEPVGLYVHLPFCESLCYYCGCNIQITKDRGRSGSYVASVIREIETLGKLLGKRRTLTQVSWGGGTPTFLSVAEIRELHEATLAVFDMDPTADVSVEVDPRVTSDAQLAQFRQLGFNRVSLGVQDFDPAVQKAVHREQSAEMTGKMLAQCRTLGFKGINFDLIYGLPLQTPKSFERTVDQILEMMPDRIALYNYARLPSLLPHQGILEKFPMPGAEDRVEIFTAAYERLTRNGYAAIGMDHFARHEDALCQAIDQGTLYRNFMGYVVKRGTNLLGVGASAIGEVAGGFFQNTKSPKDYEKQINDHGVATLRGLLFSPEDRRRKWVIQQLMCAFELRDTEYQKVFGESFPEHFAGELQQLGGFFEDGILIREPGVLKVSLTGRLFIRNVAMIFDAYLNNARNPRFSKTV